MATRDKTAARPPETTRTTGTTGVAGVVGGIGSTVDVAGVPAEFLEARIVEHAALLARGTHQLLVFVGELDARGTYVTWGALSCASWLAEACDVDVGTARTWVRVARAMRRHRELGEAMADRRVSYGKARVLVPYLAGFDPGDPRVGEVIGLAASTCAAALGRVVADWARGHEDPDESDERHDREQRLSWRTDPDGMVTGTFRLPPLEAGKVIAQIDRRVMSLSRLLCKSLVVGSDVTGEAVGVGDGECAEGGFPAVGGGALDEVAGGLAFVAGLAGFGGSLTGPLVLDVADGEP